MALGKAEVAHIAKLARIRLNDAELAALSGELSQILEWMEELRAIDTGDVPPMTSVAAMRLDRKSVV